MPNKIDSDKVFINKAFEWWYRVPDYQRPYVWGTDQVTDLLDDVTQWMYSRPDTDIEQVLNEQKLFILR